jgi:tetratricopeptide (TPR) repeat protein
MMGGTLSQQGTGAYLNSVAQGVAGNLTFSAVCALCAAFGLIKGKDISDLQNWPLWMALVGLCGVGFVGAGANAFRLWWKKRQIARASGERLTIILANLVGDDAHASQKEKVRDSLRHYLGASIQILKYPQAFAIAADGHDDAELAKTHKRAQKLLAQQRGDVLIWGRVDPSGGIALHFTGRLCATSETESYRQINETERPLELPIKFDRDLGAAIAARVVAVGDALIDRQGCFLNRYADTFAEQIKPLVAHPKANWTADARGAVFFAYGVAKDLSGREHPDSAALEEAVAAYRTALEEWTRDRVPLDWAMTQMNLGNTLGKLGERENGTGRLEEAVAAFRAALEERTRDRPLDWAMTQMNLGNALKTLGARESGTARLEEAVAAYRAALEEMTRDRVPLDWAMTQSNLGAALRTLGERENGTGRLEEAVAAYRAALEEMTRDRVPLAWAMTQSNLGNALSTLGERESGTARLEEAVAAYRAALEEWTRDLVPLQWAMTQNNLGGALKTGSARAGRGVLRRLLRPIARRWRNGRKKPLHTGMT